MHRLLLILALTLFLPGCGGGCGNYFGRPVATTQTVTTSDVLGEWRYHTTKGKRAEITLREDGTFEQRLGPDFTPHEGTWELDGVWLRFTGFRFSDSAEDEEIDFYLTSDYTDEVAPFGGDAGDPDIWVVWSRPREDD